MIRQTFVLSPNRRNLFPVVAVALLGAALCVVLGVAIALDIGLYIPVFFGLLLIGLPWIVRGWPSYAQGRAGLFWWMFALMFAAAFASLITPIPVYGVVEVWLISVAALGATMLPWWLQRSVFARWFVGLFVVFALFGLASSFVEHSRWLAGAYQFVYNLKLPVMLLLGFRIGWSAQTDSRFWQVLSWLWVPIAIVVAIELVAPGLYYSFAKNVAEGGIGIGNANPFLRGLLNRVTGPFEHSGLLAYFSATLLCMIAARMMSRETPTSPALRLAAVAYLVLLILSGQRQESTAMLSALAILFFVFRVRFSVLAVSSAVLVGCMAIASVLIVLGSDQVATLLDEWGLTSDVNPITAARTVFYRDSIFLANEHFPLGTGLGTFGGEGAQKFDHHLYLQLGYGRYWWYQLNWFLVDTYWPNFIAEAGWLGGGALFVAVCGLSAYALYRTWRAGDTLARQLWGMAFAAQFIALSVSATSPIYSDPNVVGLAMLLFGTAFRHSVDLESRNSWRGRGAERGLHGTSSNPSLP